MLVSIIFDALDILHIILPVISTTCLTIDEYNIIKNTEIKESNTIN